MMPRHANALRRLGEAWLEQQKAADALHEARAAVRAATNWEVQAALNSGADRPSLVFNDDTVLTFVKIDPRTGIEIKRTKLVRDAE